VSGDEMKVESFELTDPLGNKNIFAKFEDGLVFYKFPGTVVPYFLDTHVALDGQFIFQL
jgi:hypothetical protein